MDYAAAYRNAGDGFAAARADYNPDGSHRTIHYGDTRLAVNAGMEFPTCYAGATLLDTDKGRLPTARDILRVTCKRCLRKLGA